MFLKSFGLFTLTMITVGAAHGADKMQRKGTCAFADTTKRKEQYATAIINVACWENNGYDMVHAGIEAIPVGIPEQNNVRYIKEQLERRGKKVTHIFLKCGKYYPEITDKSDMTIDPTSITEDSIHGSTLFVFLDQGQKEKALAFLASIGGQVRVNGQLIVAMTRYGEVKERMLEGCRILIEQYNWPEEITFKDKNNLGYVGLYKNGQLELSIDFDALEKTKKRG